MLRECGLLREAWYAAGRSEDVPRGKPISRLILGQPLVLFRDGGGNARALLDRCLHRNAPLSEGVVLEGKLACPYHGWTYDGSGRCVGIPSCQDHKPVPGLPVLQGYPTREQDGLVWVWMGQTEPDRPPFSMPYWSEPGWTAYYMVTPFENEVTHLVENFMDVPHTVFVHRKWFRSPARKRVRTLVERTPDSVLVTYDQPSDSIGISSRILNPQGRPMLHTDKFYMPNNTRVDYDFGGSTGFVITSTCTPRGPMDTLVYTLISVKLGHPLANAIGRALLPFYTREVIRQDVDIMRVHGRNLKRFKGETAFHHSAADLLHEHIEALRGWAQAGGQGPRPAPRIDEIEMWI